MQRRDLNAPDAPAAAGAYSQAVEVSGVSRTLYISGQIGVEPDGGVPDDVTAQTRIALKNLVAQLSAAGMGIGNLVKLTTIITNSADIPAVRAVRMEVLGDWHPASTLIVGGLASSIWKVEVEGIAVA